MVTRLSPLMTQQRRRGVERQGTSNDHHTHTWSDTTDWLISHTSIKEYIYALDA